MTADLLTFTLSKAYSDCGRYQDHCAYPLIAILFTIPIQRSREMVRNIIDCRDVTVPLIVSVQTIWEAFISYVSGTSFTNDLSFNRVL